MRQILLNARGAVVARMPRPALEPGTVLVGVRYSLISTGTELATLGPASGADAAAPAERIQQQARLARRYLGAALRQPRKAASRVVGLARERLSGLGSSPAPVVTIGDLAWTRAAASSVDVSARRLRVTTDDSAGSYQVLSQPIAVTPGRVPVVHVRGRVEDGPVAIGLLDDTRAAWLGIRAYPPGEFADRLIFDPTGSSEITIVVAAAGAGRACTMALDEVSVVMAPPLVDGLPQSELDQQGWNVGYSAAGVVLAVGDDITDLRPGDRVACAGAGYANHAEVIAVPRNLVCRVPDGCALEHAATATVGAIALQGVRRTAPALGERIAVLGLGLIGQLTVQLLRANGCTVLGMDLDAHRVERARRLGMAGGATGPDDLVRLVRDRTAGHGADATIIAAATKSDTVVNLAMDVTRRRGRVVVVGDVGLNVERAAFYRKEIDLLMSTSVRAGPL